MAVLDRLILRMAICELLRDPEHAAGGGDQRGARAGAHVQHRGPVKFINGMLDAIRKKLDASQLTVEVTVRTQGDAKQTSVLSPCVTFYVFRRRTDPATARRTSTSSRSSASRSIRARSSGGTRSPSSSTRYGAADARRARGRAHRDDHQRPHSRDPLVRQGELPRALRRPREDAGLRPPGLAAGARFPDLQAARFRRLGRRRRAAVPHQDQRVHDLGVAAALPGEVPAAAAGEVARPDRRRDPLPAALPRPDRQPRFAARVRDAQPRRRRDPRVHDRARLPRGRDADDAADCRRRDRAAVRRPITTRSTWISTSASRRSCT